MIGIRSAISIRARGHRPHLEAVYMTAPRSACRNTKKALAERGPSIHDGIKTRHTPAVIARLDRAIQYSEGPVMEQKSRGVLDTPPESVIGLAQCQAR